MPKHFVKAGLDWITAAGAQRAEPGEVRDDLPKVSLPWLLEQGHVEVYDPKVHDAPPEEPESAPAAPDADPVPAGQENTTEAGGEPAGGES